jgi:hypothetical protein
MGHTAKLNHRWTLTCYSSPSAKAVRKVVYASSREEARDLVLLLHPNYLVRSAECDDCCDDNDDQTSL